MGEKVEGLSIEQLQEINDELNERNQKLAAQIREMEKEHQELIINFNKSDRMLGKMISKIGLYESKIMHYEIRLEDVNAELNGYRETGKAEPDDAAE